MLSLRSLLLASLVTIARLTEAKSSSGDSVLVVLEPDVSKDDYSIFFSGLTKRGYELTFRAPKDVQPGLFDDSTPKFSHVVMFAPTSKHYAKDITPQSLITLLDANTNLLIALSPKQTPLSSFASEFSLILPPPNTPLISHFPEREEPVTLIPIGVSSSHSFLSPNIPAVWFSGIPFATGTNPLLVPILNAPMESFASDSIDDSGAESLVEAAEKAGEGLWAGSKLSVVSGFQTRTNSRVVFVGGIELFSDKYAQKEVAPGQASGNEIFSQEIAAWAFQETNVLRVESIEHHRLNETETPKTYTTNDEVVYTATVTKWNKNVNAWVPCTCRKDIQLEFTMLDPHIRTNLPPVSNKPGEYSTTFRAPDRHGVFKFVIDYKRTGWSSIQSSTTVPVVPPRHDGYPRFISAAWPYYVGAFSTSVGFVIFSSLFLAQDVREKKTMKFE